MQSDNTNHAPKLEHYNGMQLDYSPSPDCGIASIWVFYKEDGAKLLDRLEVDHTGQLDFIYNHVAFDSLSNCQEFTSRSKGVAFKYLTPKQKILTVWYKITYNFWRVWWWLQVTANGIRNWLQLGYWTARKYIFKR
jgi:hypothetical protein